jgi:hypothetical protein
MWRETGVGLADECDGSGCAFGGRSAPWFLLAEARGAHHLVDGAEEVLRRSPAAPGIVRELIADGLVDLLEHCLSVAAADDGIASLSGPANVNSKAKRSFEKFAAELEASSVPADWRVLPADRARALHGRVIADDQAIYEVPPLNSVLAGTVDSIRTSEIPLDSFTAAYAETGTSMSDYQPSA